MSKTPSQSKFRHLWGVSLCLALALPCFFLLAGASGCESYNFANNSSGHEEQNDNDRGRGYDRDYSRDQDLDRNDNRDNDNRLYTYDYYPKREVFFNQSTGEYTYWNNGRMSQDRKVPEFIRDQLGRDRVTLRLRGTDPERYRDRVKRDYPPDRDYSRDDQHDRFNGAPVYGDRRTARAYDYYPNRKVLQDASSQDYTFINNGKVTHTRDLPDYVRKAMGSERKRVFISGNDPERYLDQLGREYPGWD